MIVHTIQDTNGILYPKVILETQHVREAVRNGVVVPIDYGLETVLNFLDSKDGQGFYLATCSLNIFENYE